MTARAAAVSLLAGLVALAAGLAVSAGGARANARPCSSYPRPGTTAGGRAPADLRAQYAVLRRPARQSDQFGLNRLGSLPESGIERGAIRYLGPIGGGGHVYLVPAAHLLTAPLTPARCVPRAQRKLWAALLPQLRRDYAYEALCLVIVYPGRAAPTCQRAPGTVAPLLYGPGSPGFGLAPDGIARIALHFFGHSTIRARVRDNFWTVRSSSILVAPCGVDWLDSRGLVLRTVVSCTADKS